jgi:mRNA-degrading endonuclease RelE of RelBE toxin-antitoxin system
MSYEVGFKPAALRQLRKLDADVQVLIVTAIESLAEYPRPEGCKKTQRRNGFVQNPSCEQVSRCLPNTR